MHNNTASLYISIILILCTLGYGLFEARNLIIGPILTVQYPTPGALLTDTLFEVHGNAQNVTHLMINGQPVTMNLTGDFTETRITPDGYGVLLIEAVSRFGRKTSKRVEIYGNVERIEKKEENMATSTSSSTPSSTQ
ncbi:MAG: hypothetical protein KBD24_02760 [Candidatus Pacebacteria bacterium]|nr:hypothetical protein [Candidatus Paceibacterota bacterium]